MEGATTSDDVARALERWREVTAPLSHARNDRDAQLMAAASPPRRGADHKETTRSVNAWSHGEFVARVASFGVATWFAKPLSISPLACARFGWVNSARDLLTCSHCARVLCFKIDDTLSAKGAEAVAAQFARQLESAHDTACPWSHNGSPESFTMLPLLGPSQVAQALRERTETLLTVAKASSHAKRALVELQVNEQAVTKLLDAAGGDVDEKTLANGVNSDELMDTSVVFRAVLLSACGWIAQDKRSLAEKDSGASLVVSCEFCNRHVRLHATPEAAPEAKEDGGQEEDDTPPPAKRQRVSVGEQKPIDPIAEHRWFCPWVVSQRRHSAQDEARIRDTMAFVSSAVSSSTNEDPDSKHGSLSEFVALPGWRQCAVALRHVASPSITTNETTNPRKKHPSAFLHVSASDALASVQSVLSLPDSY